MISFDSLVKKAAMGLLEEELDQEAEKKRKLLSLQMEKISLENWKVFNGVIVMTTIILLKNSCSGPFEDSIQQTKFTTQ